MNVAEYVELSLGWKAEWGDDDCTLFAANWIRLRTGRDPAKAWRGTYHTRNAAHKALRRQGGLLSVATAEMLAAGFAETTEPKDGDVGIVVVPIGVKRGQAVFGNVGAIRLGTIWAVRSEDGVAAFDFECKRAWSIRA